jgi:hypothetical protein
MARYRITGPDGATYEVTAPEGATDADVMAYVQQHHAAQQQTPAQHYADLQQQAGTQSPEDAARAEYDASPWYERAAISTGAEFANLGRGIGQLVTPNDSAVHQRLVAASDADAPYQDAPHGATNVLGRALPYLATLPLGATAGAAGKVVQGGRLAQAALAAGEGAGYGALQETRTGQSRGQNMLIGGALGLGGQQVARALRSVGEGAANAIKPEVRAIYDKAKALGINLTPAQLSDSRRMKYMQSQFGMLPLSGGAAKSEQQVGQWNQQLAKAIGVDAPVVTPEVYANKKAADSAMFDALTARNNLTVTPDLVRALQQIEKDAHTVGVGDDVRRAAEGLYSQMSPDGIVPGAAYQGLDSILGTATKKGDTAAHFVGLARSAIRNAMDASISPEDAAAWKQLRGEYANRKTITPIVDPNGGPISPQALMARVKATKAGKERMASGQGGTLGDLASVGQRMKPPPSSGTAERILVNDLITPWKWPGLALGSTVGRAANSNLLAGRMMSPNRGQLARTLAPVVAQSPKLAPLLIALMAQQQPADAGNGP